MTDPAGARRTARLFVLGVAVLAVSMVLALMLGAFSISVEEVIGWLTGRGTGTPGGVADRVLWSIRLPRVLAAVVLGAALGSAGAVLQGTFRTPLADPHLLGFSAAAGAGAAIGYAMTPAGAYPVLPVALAVAFATAFGLIASALRSRTGTDRFLLAGVALGFALLAWTGIFVLVVDSPRVPTFLFFVFGSLAGTTWKVLALSTMAIVPAIAAVWFFGNGLDLLSLGDRDAQSVGFNVRRLVPLITGLVGVAIGAAVALGGVVGFVGLIVPFALRPLIGPKHRILIPASALGGAIVVVAADTFARTVASPAEIPLGLVTAAFGGPFLGWLLLRRRPA